MDENYTIIDNKNNITEIKEIIGELYVKNYTYGNNECFIIKKLDKKLKFSFTKLNGIYYVTINGDYILDYKKFICINKIEIINDKCIINNNLTGNISLSNCDIEIISKGLELMNDYMKKKGGLLNTIWYYLFV